MGFSDAVRSIRSIWGHGDDDYDTERDDLDDAETDNTRDDYKNSQSSGYGSGYSSNYRSSAAGSSDSSDYGSMPSESKYSSSAYPAGRSSYGSSSPVASTPAASGSSNAPVAPSAPSSRMRSANPTLRAREKNIYTIKPKRLDEATVAADCLKTGSAVIVNLEAVDRITAVRIVDFMSGVCYGIDGSGGQSGNAMKLGEMIFLFTPAEFEITSDETDYAANQEHFFREITEGQIVPPSAAAAGALPISPAGSPAPPNPASGSFASSYNSPVDYAAERRAWER